MRQGDHADWSYIHNVGFGIVVAFAVLGVGWAASHALGVDFTLASGVIVGGAAGVLSTLLVAWIANRRS